MTTKKATTCGGHLYYSVPTTAKLIGTTTTKLKSIALAEGMQFENLRVNGKLWIRADSVDAYLSRRTKAQKR